MPAGRAESHSEAQSNAAHKTRRSGGKVKKAKGKDKKARHNPKAFTFSGGVTSVQRQAQYALDHETKRERAKLLPDKTPDDSPPPLVVAVQGPPGVGKSTLIRSLVKHYTRHNVSEVKGTITLVAGKRRRLTIIECTNDATSMLDVAKIADLVLLLIDGSYGFEMETFEFLNILQTHGFPRVIGVLTHLDSIKETRILRKTKKKLKNRFWAEIYNGAKLFYLSGLQYGRYNKTEILNLSRFVAVQKPRPLEFRSQRPYLLALRYEDQTSAQEQDVDSEDRTVHFYGYVNGATLRSGTTVHIPGAGDFVASSVTSYMDPCPLPSRTASKNDGARNMRTLKHEERRVYAPGCDIGNVSYDADALYIQLPNHRVGFTKTGKSLLCSRVTSNDGDDNSDEASLEELPEPVALVRDLQEVDGKLDENVETQQLRLVATSRSVLLSSTSRRETERRPAPEFGSAETENHVDNESTDEQVSDEEDYDENTSYGDEEEDDENASYGDEEERPSVAGENEKTREQPGSLLASRLVANYDAGYLSHSEDESIDSGSTTAQSNAKDVLGHRRGWTATLKGVDSEHQSLARRIYQPTKSTKSAFGARPQGNTKMLFQDDAATDDEDNSLSNHSAPLLLGDCEDPVMAQRNESSVFSDFLSYKCVGSLASSVFQFGSPQIKAQLKERHFITGGWDGPDELKANDEETSNGPPTLEKEGEASERIEDILASQRQRVRETDAAERAQVEEAQAFLRSSESGFVIGTYCRVVVKRVPASWVDQLGTISKAIVLGGLLPNECGPYDFFQLRLKKHRWAPKILKSEDPLLISVGWRRFQSLPLYCIEDRGNVRVRALKYTPEHMHCLAVIYGPLQPPGTGVVAIRNWAASVRDFRISATGVVLETAAQFMVMKKLKLVGEPMKVFKNTAFIKNMFNSDLEVAKCIGSKVQTVSGVRGQIKKANGTDGTFRATFEDKILMSDIVVCKTWIRVLPKRFCNPLLDIPEWRRLRTLVELRHELGVPQKDTSSTDYGAQPTRETRRFNPLRVPKELLKNLPFRARPKEDQKRKAPTGLLGEATALTLNPYEKQVATLFQRLHLITKQRHLERKTAALMHKSKLEKEEAKAMRVRLAKNKMEKKRKYALQGMQELKLRKRQRMEEQ